MRKKVLVIYNPCSGCDLSRKSVKDFYDAFTPERFDLTVIRTQKRNDARRIAYENAEKYDLIVSAGGDGTFNEVINGIMPSLKPLAYYPNGTTNDTAKTLGIGSKIEETVSLIEKDTVKNIDIGKMDDRYFFCTVSFGFGSNASLKAKQSSKNVLGHFAYIISGIKNISDIKPIKMNIKIDDEIISGEFAFGAVVNTISVGGIFFLDKNTFNLSDGEFEVVLVPKIKSMLEVPKMISLLKKQKFDNRHLIVRKCKSITFQADRKIPWLIDGECGGYRSSVNIDVIKNGISVYADPKNSYV